MNNEILVTDEDGLEAELITDETVIDTPFNPKDVKIDLKTMTIDLLVNRIKQNEINLFTDFQRKGDLWDTKKQSQLIESLLIRLPLPAFYFDASNDNSWLIVDGLQRITTLKNFIVDKTLKLENLEYLNLNDKNFDDLSRELQRRIEETQIVTYQIAEGTPQDVKYNLFKRINTGGLKLEPQEIRHALNQGVPANFIKKLADSKEFLNATQNSIKKDRMKDRDLVNRFIAFYLNDYKLYNSDLDTFLNNAMSSLKKLKDSELDTLKSNFYKALNCSLEIFGDFAFRKITSNSTRGPINKALFEIITVNFSKLETIQINALFLQKEQIVFDYFELLKSEKFSKSISTDTGGVQNVKTRFTIFNEFINNFLEGTNDITIQN